VISGAAATVLEREYYETQGGTPAGERDRSSRRRWPIRRCPVPSVRNGGCWARMTANGRNSGATLAGLVPGNYLVECKPIAGRAAPPPIAVLVLEGETRAATATYFLEDAPIGTLPGVLPFETVSTSRTAAVCFRRPTAQRFRRRDGLCGQAEGRSATAGRTRSSTKGTLSYTTGTQWLFQRDRGTYEPKPQSPRGFYIFEGYAAQRASEGTPGESSPESQNLDVAAVYFLEDAGRGGSSGYLGSNAMTTSGCFLPELKILTGYPVDDIAPEFQGRMHATPPANVKFALRSAGHLPRPTSRPVAEHRADRSASATMTANTIRRRSISVVPRRRWCGRSTVRDRSFHSAEVQREWRGNNTRTRHYSCRCANQRDDL
jgi:hypothetical protein